MTVLFRYVLLLTIYMNIYVVIKKSQKAWHFMQCIRNDNLRFAAKVMDESRLLMKPSYV